MSYITIKRNGKKQAVNLDRKKRSYVPTKVLKAADLKKIHIHGLSLAGYALDLADGLRKKALEFFSLYSFLKPFLSPPFSFYIPAFQLYSLCLLAGTLNNGHIWIIGPSQ